ncbi:MAG: grasp-with-spasm system ATP-grasp peptide maturase [Agriterribacter sp.]
MILIFSIDGDISTDIVETWLNFYNYPFKKITSSELICKSFLMDINDRTIKLDNEQVNLESVGAIWFRRFTISNSNYLKKIGNELDFEVANQINKEFLSISKGIYSSLIDKFWLVNPFSATSINKFRVLSLAKKFNLEVPESYIISRKEDLKELINKKNCISKSAFEFRFMYTNKGFYSMYTTNISDDIQNKLPEIFFPSLIQVKIKKSYEIRSFFLDNCFYSMAIFSQQNAQTETDFRMYAWNKPNRFIPYNLPHSIEQKLKALLRKLELNCASIDLIKGCDGQYYFLEVNPAGQFGMVDFSCNYGLHKKVAEFLIKWDKKYLRQKRMYGQGIIK